MRCDSGGTGAPHFAKASSRGLQIAVYNWTVSHEELDATGGDLEKSGIGPFTNKDWKQPEEEIDLIYSSLSEDVGFPVQGGSHNVNSRREAKEHETSTFLGRKRDSKRIGTPTKAVDCP